MNKLDKLINTALIMQKTAKYDKRDCELIICMDKDTVIELHNACMNENSGVRGKNTEQMINSDAYLNEFYVHGIPARVICDSGIGWFIGDMSYVR